MLEILFPNSKEGKSCKTFLAFLLPLDMQHFSHSSQYATFSQSLVNADFFNFWDRPWWKCLKASSCSRYQNILSQKFDLSRNTSSKNPDETKYHLYMFPIHWICLAPSVISNATANMQFPVIYCHFYII